MLHTFLIITYFLELVDGMDGQLIEELMTSEGKLISMQKIIIEHRGQTLLIVFHENFIFFISICHIYIVHQNFSQEN